MSHGFENVLGMPVNFPWSFAASIDKNDSAFHIVSRKNFGQGYAVIYLNMVGYYQLKD
jgi:hypothetical protein